MVWMTRVGAFEDSAEIGNVVLMEGAIPFQPKGTEKVAFLQR